MTKKHFQALAGALHGVKPELDPKWCDELKQEASVALQHWRECYGAVADVCAASNPAFDRARFIEACETGTTKGMRRVS